MLRTALFVERDPMAVIEAPGWNGVIRINEARVEIEKFRPKGYAIDAGGSGTWSTLIAPMMSIHFKSAKGNGVRTWGTRICGYLQLVGPGVTLRAGALTWGNADGFKQFAQDPATVIFEKKHEPAILDVRRAIEVAIHRSAAPVQDPAAVLRGLSDLMIEGIISGQEFDWAKANILGQPPDGAQESLRLVRQLYELYRTGALSEGEYNQKKWDLLSRR